MNIFLEALAYTCVGSLRIPELNDTFPPSSPAGQPVTLRFTDNGASHWEFIVNQEVIEQVRSQLKGFRDAGRRKDLDAIYRFVSSEEKAGSPRDRRPFWARRPWATGLQLVLLGQFFVSQDHQKRETVILD